VLKFSTPATSHGGEEEVDIGGELCGLNSLSPFSDDQRIVLLSFGIKIATPKNQTLQYASWKKLPQVQYLWEPATGK
jgi:hypothetical protein